MMTTSNEHNNAPAVPAVIQCPISIGGSGAELARVTPDGDATIHWAAVEQAAKEDNHFLSAMAKLLIAARDVGRAAAPAVPQGAIVGYRVSHPTEPDLGTWLVEEAPTDPTDLLVEPLVLAATPAPSPAQERCHLCDCTGDIHDATGEWRDECPYCKPEQEVTQSEPIYQLQRGDGSWIDQDKASYDYNAQYGINTIRIVYTAPAPAQEPVDMVPRAALHEVERERDWYKTRSQTMYEHQNGQVWYWQGGGEDHPETLVNSLPVVIRADQLRELIAKPTREVGLTDDEIDENTVWLDQDPLDTVRHCDVSATVHKCVAALRAKGGK